MRVAVVPMTQIRARAHARLWKAINLGANQVLTRHFRQATREHDNRRSHTATEQVRNVCLYPRVWL